MLNEQQIVLLRLSLRKFGNKKKGDLGAVETVADKALLSLGKQLLDCAEYDAVSSLDGKIDQWITRRSLPSEFKRGIYRINPVLADQIEDRLLAFQAERDDLVVALSPAYMAAIQAARLRLADQFRAGDYPEPFRFLSRFGMEWSYFSLGAPDALQGLNVKLFQEQKNKLRGMFQEAEQAGILLIRERFKEFTSTLADRLESNPDGTRKRFEKGSMTNLLEFCESFKFVDLADDKDLRAEIDRCKGLLSGLDVGRLRDNDALREATADGFKRLAESAALLVQDAPRRFVALD